MDDDIEEWMAYFAVKDEREAVESKGTSHHAEIERLKNKRRGK